MKIRTGFVANSSTSTYICELCGAILSGMDVSPSEYEWHECPHGHCICNDDDHLKNIDMETKANGLKKAMLEYEYYGDEDKKRITTILNGMTDPESIMSYYEEWRDDYYPDYNLTEEECPICKMEDATADDLLAFAVGMGITTKEKLLQLVRDSFGNYDEFRKFLNKVDDEHRIRRKFSEW